MAEMVQTPVEEQALLESEAPPRASYRKRALLLAGGVAAAALVAVGASSRAASLRGGAAVAVEGSIELDEAKDVPKEKSREAFMENSVPFKGGRNGVLDTDEHGGLLINEDGEWKEYYLPGAEIVDGGKTVKYTPPYRFYLMKFPTTDYSKSEHFYKPKFVGKTFTVDMKVTNVGCGCNLNFYLVDMPWSQPGHGGDHYCDAQCFSGLGCCAEFDMCEGNANVQQITNHACSNNYGGIGHGDWQCHKWGDPEVKTGSWDFNMGRSSSVDGNKPFTYSQEFRLLPGDQLQIITTISQGSHRVVKTMGPSEQLQHMYKHGSLENGMVFVTGYWHDSAMNWLDSDECGSGPEHCSMSPAYISNWRITTNGNAVPAPAPMPDDGGDVAPSPAGAGHNHKCCYGNGASCKEADSWCAQSGSNCGQCNGQWGSFHCCYGDGFGNCKDSSSWCSQSGSNCGQCNGNWRMK